ncbi:unnamed protein product, partial [Phaeothamnion confervicola]
ELREAFGIFDVSKSGSIGIHELKVLMRALGFPVKKTEVLQLVFNEDPQNEGACTFELVQNIMAENRYAALDPEEEMAKAFRLFDDDDTGKITLKNMRRVVRELGETMSEEELQALIDEFDRDQDGAISKDEFISIMRQSSAY